VRKPSIERDFRTECGSDLDVAGRLCKCGTGLLAWCVEYDVTFKGCESPMDRNDRNHPSKQGCPSRGGI
jgi:hypothetical protein